MSELDPESTTDQVIAGADLSGRRFVVTGSSSGLGEESARALAAHGASVTMAARNAEKNQAAALRIREAHPGADLELRELDLADLGSVRAFAVGLLADHPSFDVLLNNAGVMVCPFGHTADGFEMQFGTNHLGHFLLTGLLIDAVTDRVVTLSSGAHLISDVDLADPQFESTEYEAWLSYGRSKSANALFALDLADRVDDRGLQSFSIHPGMVATELARHMTEELMNQMQERIAARTAGAPADDGPRMSTTFRTPDVGAATQVWAATSADLGDHNGAYLYDCHVGVTGPDVAPYIGDLDSARKLWTLSEELVGHRWLS